MKTKMQTVLPAPCDLRALRRSLCGADKMPAAFAGEFERELFTRRGVSLGFFNLTVTPSAGPGVPRVFILLPSSRLVPAGAAAQAKADAPAPDREAALLSKVTLAHCAAGTAEAREAAAKSALALAVTQGAKLRRALVSAEAAFSDILFNANADARSAALARLGLGKVRAALGV